MSHLPFIRSSDSGDTPDEPEPGAYRRARLVVAYRGTDFHGVAPNAGVRTVIGELTQYIGLIVRCDVDATVAGRTDAGVHAWGQVVSMDLPVGTDLSGLVRRFNKLGAPNISVRSAEWAAPDFNARFAATSRRYRYHVWNAPSPNPLLADVAWHVPRPLDLSLMDSAAGDLIGEHDFSSFCRRPRPAPGAREPSLTRIVTEAKWLRLGTTQMVRFEVAASAFCHQQVRSMVGTLVDIGLGRRPCDEIPRILAAADRSAAGTVAPPHGLVLWEVGYDGQRWDAARPWGDADEGALSQDGTSP